MKWMWGWRSWSSYYGFLSCGGPTELVHSCIPCATSITSRCWTCIPPLLLVPLAFRVVYPWCSLAIPSKTPCLGFLKAPRSWRLASEPLKLGLGSVHPWYPCWSIFLRWECCYTYLRPLSLPIMWWITCLPPIQSSWNICSPWRGYSMR